MAAFQRTNNLVIDATNTYLDTFIVNTGSTIVEGELVILNASGLLIQAPDSILAANLIVGKAMGSVASAAAGTTLGVQVFRTGTTIRIPVYHGTPASAVTAQTFLNPTLPNHGLTRATVSGVSQLAYDVSIANTTNAKGKVRDIPPVYPVGEQYGLVDYAFGAAHVMFP